MAITVAVASGLTTAGASFANHNNGKVASVEMHSPGEEYDAKGISAQWVIERAPGTTLANFGEIKFTEAAAAESDGTKHTLANALTVDLVVDGKTLAKGAVNGDSEVDITYTGS